MNVKKMIGNIHRYMTDRGYKYDIDVVESLFVSLKVKPFVVVCGPCGCGKNSLVRLYAEALGANVQNGRFKEVAVCADWTSSARLFGDVTPDGKFVPGIVTGFIQRAIADIETPYFLCLDEINLARPEQYLSSVISMMETRRRDEEGRIVTNVFFDKESFGNDISASFGYDGIYLPENLYIFGTLNTDDVSHTLTPKFVDRVNVIELPKPDLVHTPDIEGIVSAKKSKPVTVVNDDLKPLYISLDECDADLEILKERSSFLQNINNTLKLTSFGISMRSATDILLYILLCRKYGLLDTDSMTDRAICQKILPQISGCGSSVKTILSIIYKVCMRTSSTLYSEAAESLDKEVLLNHYGERRYPVSAEKISHMIRRYDEDGYTSFWE